LHILRRNGRSYLLLLKAEGTPVQR
jgi:hypothetical protein